MFDVFYLKNEKKPGIFAHEKPAVSLQDAQSQSRTRYFWWITYLADYSTHDWDYQPVPWQSEYTHTWPSQHHEYSGTYLVPKSGEIKYHFHDKIIPNKSSTIHFYTAIQDVEFDYSWAPHPHDPPYIYVFGNQWWSAEKMPTVEYHSPGATERKYVSWPRAGLLPDSTNWTVPDSVDPACVDFTWVPDPGEPAYIYQFATQHQKTGGPVYTVPGADEVKYLAELKIRTVGKATAIYEIDHLDGGAGQIPNTTRRVRYFDNYRDTLIRLAKSIEPEHEYVWVCSSICNYADFDFSWHPEQWQATMLHVFSSDDQKFGDTFFMHVPTFAARAEQKELLEWYDVNFIDSKIPRNRPAIIQHTQDSHVGPVMSTDWTGPVAVFATTETPLILPAVNLWRATTKTIVPLNSSASVVVVPKNAVPTIKTQLYDYAYIDKTKKQHMPSAQQDVIFISYDEPDADQNWEILKNKCSRAQRVHGVAGMELALEAAADISTTPWYYAVFAKTRLHDAFDFSFVPDYMQQPKNYIFNCLNRVNGLEYGHMGIVMYNCQGIKALNQQGNFGLDYTLSFSHESVPVLSCHGDFDQTPYHTWRTAFRECAKLAYFESETATVDGAYRLSTWLEKAQGPYAEWCLRGAADGVEFFNTSNQQIQTLKQSFKWEWLRSYFESRYGNLE